MSRPTPDSPTTPYVGDSRVVAACTVGAWGCAFIALFAVPWVALVLVLSWGLGLLTGLHTQAIREARWRRSTTEVVPDAR